MKKPKGQLNRIDSWALTTGWKTSLGLFRTICNMADEARGVDIEKLIALFAENNIELVFE